MSDDDIVFRMILDKGIAGARDHLLSDLRSISRLLSTLDAIEAEIESSDQRLRLLTFGSDSSEKISGNTAFSRVT